MASKDNELAEKILQHHFDKRRIFVWDEISTNSSYDVIQQMYYMYENDAKLPITLLLNNDGGSVTDMLAIIDEMEILKNKGVVISTVASGMVASAAAYIFIFGTKGYRFVRDSATIMLHPISYTIPEDYIKYQEKYNDYIKENNTNILEKVAKTIKKKVSKFTNDIDCGLWLKARDAVEYGVADKILTEPLR